MIRVTIETELLVVIWATTILPLVGALYIRHDYNTIFTKNSFSPEERDLLEALHWRKAEHQKIRVRYWLHGVWFNIRRYLYYTHMNSYHALNSKNDKFKCSKLEESVGSSSRLVGDTITLRTWICGFESVIVSLFSSVFIENNLSYMIGGNIIFL